MNDAIKSAIRKLLDMGEQAQDGKLVKLAEAKRAPPPEPECEACAMLPGEETCEACAAKTGGEDESELAALLEQGAA